MALSDGRFFWVKCVCSGGCCRRRPAAARSARGRHPALGEGGEGEASARARGPAGDLSPLPMRDHPACPSRATALHPRLGMRLGTNHIVFRCQVMPLRAPNGEALPWPNLVAGDEGLQVGPKYHSDKPPHGLRAKHSSDAAHPLLSGQVFLEERATRAAGTSHPSPTGRGRCRALAGRRAAPARGAARRAATEDEQAPPWRRRRRRGRGRGREGGAPAPDAAECSGRRSVRACGLCGRGGTRPGGRMFRPGPARPRPPRRGPRLCGARASALEPPCAAESRQQQEQEQEQEQEQQEQ
jgi:hypothetical protein